MKMELSQKIELLAPAGNLEKLEFVLHYGADAVYLGGQDFSLRNFADNFTPDQIAAAIALAHGQRAKVYVAVNIFARNQDLKPLEQYLRRLGQIEPDGIIIADPALIPMVRQFAHSIPIHLSTQANTTNLKAADFWHSQGIQRINLARELTLSEISEIATGSKVHAEVFVHGAMCISYSGRCLLSNFMARRPSNQGMCCQPCRFEYAVVEATRPGQYFPVMEDSQGAYIFNSKDLCMLAHLPAIIQSGVRAVKIEGRMKGIHYAATSVKIYREAIDNYYLSPHTFEVNPYWQSELDKITARGYCTGFYFDDPNQVVPCYSAPTASTYRLVGNVVARTKNNLTQIQVRNRIHIGDQLELVSLHGPPKLVRLKRIIDQQGQLQETAHPGTLLTIDLGSKCQKYDLLRKQSTTDF